MTRDGGRYRPEQGNSGTILTPAEADPKTRKELEKGNRATKRVASKLKGRDDRGGKRAPEVHHDARTPGK